MLFVQKNMKCVILINDELPLGLIANTSAVLGLTIGDKIKGIIGDDVSDKDGSTHRGITNIPIPLLKGSNELIRSLRKTLVDHDDDIFFVDFCDVAQQSKNYDDYSANLQERSGEELNYLGLGICGPAQKVKKLTGNLGLLR